MQKGFNRFPQIRAQLIAQGGPVVRKAAFDTQGQAQSLAPVDTGNLKNSIMARGNGLRYIVGTNVEYAIHQEYGTRHQSGKAFLRPAVERVRPAFIAAWKSMLQGLGRR